MVQKEEQPRTASAHEQKAVRLSSPVIALMTDFGLRDGFVGIMKGVIAGIVPQAQFIDISHDIAPQNVAAGAWLLSTAYRYFPAGSIFLCVVDPELGASGGPLRWKLASGSLLGRTMVSSAMCWPSSRCVGWWL